MRAVLHRLVLTLGLALLAPAASAFDQTHVAFNALLARHVHVLAGGVASRVDYRGFAADRAALDAYLQTLSAVTRAEFDTWSREERQAFLIDAYNAYTIALVLTGYPTIDSIKDLGGLFSSPWQKQFFQLLGRPETLDGIEHGTLRAPGAYDDPRIHFALNCASIGCPMLANEAYVAEHLDAQLESAVRRFLSDRTRNRYDAARGRLQVSKIFDWYRGDFEAGHRGYRSVPDFLGHYADVLADAPADRGRVQAGAVPIEYLDYDWSLNATER